VPKLRVLHFSGSPGEMGEAFGESCRAQIAELYEIRLRNALAQALAYGGRAAREEDLLAICRASLDATRAHHPDGFEELSGIAAGSARSIEQIMALGGLTDLRDALAWGGPLESTGGCTCFIVQADASAKGRVLCGQTWDLMTDNQPFVVAVHRQPTSGPETWCVTTVGCLSLMGMNEHGIALCTTNLRTHDARPGVPYLSLIHRALASRDHAEALASITGAHRAGAHSYCIVGDGRAVVLECTAQRQRALQIENGTHVHCNHCLVPEHAEIEGDTPRASSEARHLRMRELLEKPGAHHDLDCLQRHLADQAGGELAICRDDFSGISTNAAIVMDPAAGLLRACHGLPSRSEWVELGP
jgi:isopenicillin-N N-acyltransferase-like protein